MKMLRVLTLFLVISLLGGCAKMTEEERAKKAQDYYAKAVKAFNEKDYGDATRSFNEALKFMDYLTPQQVENAKFLLGKSYYLEGDYVNAVVALEDYIFYYPKLPRTEEAYYMLVESYMKVSPDPYRDQEYTWKAIEKANGFLSMFPNSTFASKVQELINGAYAKIAKHELLIAEFYEKYGYTYSAAIRYRDVLVNFSNYVPEEEVAFRYIRCLLLTDVQVELEKGKIGKLLTEAKKSLENLKGEERSYAERRVRFLEGEMERWDQIMKRAREEAIEALRRYREAYGETLHYRKLEELLKIREWKS